MLNVTGRFVTVYKPVIRSEVSRSIIFANIATSKKETEMNANGEKIIHYVNMYWNASFVGTAFEKAIKQKLKDGDKIRIIKGSVTNKYIKEKKFLDLKVTIYDYEMEKTYAK